MTEAKNYISGIGQYNTHTSSSIDSSVAKFGSLSSSSSYKLLIDPNLSNVDSITGLQNSTIDSNSFKVTTEEQNLVSSDSDNDYLLSDINYKEIVSHSYEDSFYEDIGFIGMNSGLDHFNQIDETNYDVFPGMESMITDII